MEEIRSNELGTTGCCGCNPLPPTPQDNNCKEECCKTKSVVCGDISTAVCIPSRIERVYDCICLEDEQMKYLRNKSFTITTTIADLRVGDEICINTVYPKSNYCMGLAATTIPVYIDNIISPVILSSSTTSPICSCTIGSAMTPLYSIYEGFAVLNTDCCEDGKKVKIAEEDLNFNICNYTLVVEGSIGCIPFKGEFVFDNGSLFTNYGFKKVDFLGRLCLPDGKKMITFEERFEGCLSTDCVTPNALYEGEGTFTADILASLLITKKIYATGKEEVVIFTSPNKLVCDKGNISSSCQSKC